APASVRAAKPDANRDVHARVGVDHEPPGCPGARDGGGGRSRARERALRSDLPPARRGRRGRGEEGRCRRGSGHRDDASDSMLAGRGHGPLRSRWIARRVSQHRPHGRWGASRFRAYRQTCGGDVGTMLLVVGGILTASIVVALGASRTGVPALVAFLALGMLLGSDGPGGIAFDDADLARQVGVVCLVAILYEGGLSTSWRRLRGVAIPAALLSTVGVVVTAVLTGLGAYALFDLSRVEAVLLGAVVASTDAAAVFATLRYTGIRRRLARTLEAETGGNDPMAIALTIGLIDWISKPSFAFSDLLVLVVRQLALGLVVGVVLGAVAMWAFAHLPRSIGAFAPVASVAAAALSFGISDVIGGSGFLAVYIVGLAVGSTPSRHRQQLVAVHARPAFLAQVPVLVGLALLGF